jgi:hypothetical protein
VVCPLFSLIEFIEQIPYEKISQTTHADWEQRQHLPEYLQTQALDEEYLRRKEWIEALAAYIPAPENMGDEMIHQLVLREMASWVRGLRVGWPAASYDYPVSMCSGRMSYHIRLNSNDANAFGIVVWARHM